MTRTCTCTGGLPSTLVPSKKQKATAACTKCDGKPFVDGLRSMSASMMGTVGLELTNFIDPELTWKTVSKGNRSAPRRPRKSVARNLKVGVDVADKSTRMAEDLAVSESEKLGVAVLGQRFGDKIEHVPIKKRRFMLQSPSPPRQALSHLEDSEQHVDNQHASGQQSSKNSIAKQQSKATDAANTPKLSSGKISEVTNVSACSEDFSGIEILATAACNNSMDDDSNQSENPVGEKSEVPEIVSLTSTTPLEENTSQKNLVCKDKYLSSQDNTIAVRENLPSDKDDTVVERSASLLDDRLHWDLNVVMDTWGQPCDTGIDTYQTNVSVDTNHSENLQIAEACEIQRESTNMKGLAERIAKPIVEVVPSDIHGEGLALGTSGLVREHEIEALTSFNQNNENLFPTLSDNVLESSMCDVADSKSPTLVTGIDACLHHSPCLGSDTITISEGCEEKRYASPASIHVRQETDDRASNMQGEENEGIILNENGEGTGQASHLGDDRGSLRKIMCVENCQSLAPGSLEVKPERKPAGEMHVDWPSPRCEDISASGLSIGGGQPVVCMSSNSKEEPAEVGIFVHIGSDQLMHMPSGNSTSNPVPCGSTSHGAFQTCGHDPASISINVAIDDTFGDSYDPDVSQDDRGCIVGMENTKELQAGYDSQFEDGELRESDVCNWEENGVGDDESERVDYGSDNGGTYDFDAADYSVLMPGRVEVRAECEEGRFCGLEAENLEKKKEISESKTVEVTDGSTIKKHNVDCVDKLGVNDFHAKMFETKASWRELVSRTENPLSSDTFHSKDSVLVQRNRSNNFGDSNKFMESDRSAMRMHGRSPFGGQWANPSAGYWDSQGHSPTYGFRRPGPKNVIESRRHVMTSEYAASEATGVAGLDSRLNRQSMSSSSNGVYRPLIGRRSPANRDEAYSMDTGIGPVRDISPDRRRYRRRPLGGSRGFRDEYHRLVPDDSTEYTNRMPLRLARVERSISPLSREPYRTQPYKKSRSRSRSRSPLARLMPRGRNEGSRWRSRSPDFRRAARIERLRVPFQKANFAAADEAGFLSLPGRRVSPHHNSRWFDEKNSEVDHIRGRRSPVRMFRRSDKYDSACPSRRLNPDDYYGPVMHPGRFPRMVSAGRGRKYEGIDDEMVHRVRRFDTDGVVRQFWYDAEDDFVAHNSRNYNNHDWDTNRRPGRTSEEKGRLRNNHDGI